MVRILAAALAAILVMSTQAIVLAAPDPSGTVCDANGLCIYYGKVTRSGNKVSVPALVPSFGDMTLVTDCITGLTDGPAGRIPMGNDDSVTILCALTKAAAR